MTLSVIMMCKLYAVGLGLVHRTLIHPCTLSSGYWYTALVGARTLCDRCTLYNPLADAA